jgi:hypothetical protein
MPLDEIFDGKNGKVEADAYLDNNGVGAPTRMFKGHRIVDWPAAFLLVRLMEMGKRMERWT